MLGNPTPRVDYGIGTWYRSTAALGVSHWLRSFEMMDLEYSLGRVRSPTVSWDIGDHQTMDHTEPRSPKRFEKGSVGSMHRTQIK